MIETLRIEGLALVERTELEFGPGLNVLTGETGAGKSLVLGALALLAGARSSSDAVREGAEEAVVEAVFDVRALPDLLAELEERGIAAEEGSLIVRRTIARSGRSRAWLGGRLVPVSVLGEVLGGRLEISSQHESQGLLRPETHGRLLDAFGGLLPLRTQVAALYARAREIEEEAARLRASAEARARSQDFLAFQVGEIDEAKVVPGELAALRAERARLVHAERLGADAAAAAAALTGDGGDASGARDLASDAVRRLDAASRLDPTLAPLAERMRGALAELADIAAEAERYAERIEADPERAAEVEERLARLERLQKKYGATEEEILAFRERAAAELAEIGGADDRLEALDAECAQAVNALSEKAATLTAGRHAAGEKLARAVEEALGDLAMASARIALAMEPAPGADGLPCGPTGAEAPELRLAANPGEPARALRRVASGGELSRVFLALKNVLRRAGAGMVLVFDEVDAGIGGRVADRVGRSLGELASEHQVLCITHLPQIAARGETHFRVEKRTKAGRTAVRAVRLEADARIQEIARMAGGERVTEATLAHARELLRAGGRG